MSSPWTEYQNSLFEAALARYDEDTPDRWQNVARAVGGSKSVEEVRRHYEELFRDVQHIDAAGRRQYNGSGSSRDNSNAGSSRGGSREEQRMKMQECKRKGIFSVGFIDPDKVHIETLTHKAEETMNNLLRFLKEQHYSDHILFPYNFKFHWILLDIQPDNGRVEVYDSLRKDMEEFRSMQDMLQRVWKIFKVETKNTSFSEELTFKSASCANQPPSTDLCGYYVCEFIRSFTTEHKDYRVDLEAMRDRLLPEQRLLAIADEIAGFFMREMVMVYLRMQ